MLTEVQHTTIWPIDKFALHLEPQEERRRRGSHVRVHS